MRKRVRECATGSELVYRRDKSAARCEKEVMMVCPDRTSFLKLK